MRYLMALCGLLWLYRPRPAGRVTALFRWRLRLRRPRWKTRGAHHRCDPPRVLRIRPAEIGMAWTLIPRDRVSGTPHEETLPGFAVPWLTARSA